MRFRIALAAIASVVGVSVAASVMAQTVRVTSLGGIDGKFCPQDRALIFDDPNGTRILYDPGRTVAAIRGSARSTSSW